jgi:hypothetical protein
VNCVGISPDPAGARRADAESQDVVAHQAGRQCCAGPTSRPQDQPQRRCRSQCAACRQSRQIQEKTQDCSGFGLKLQTPTPKSAQLTSLAPARAAADPPSSEGGEKREQDADRVLCVISKEYLEKPYFLAPLKCCELYVLAEEDARARFAPRAEGLKRSTSPKSAQLTSLAPARGSGPL